MKIHTFTIQFHDGARIRRSEWGRTRRDALKTLWGIYGKENFLVIA